MRLMGDYVQNSDYKSYTVDDVIRGLHTSRHIPAIGGPPIPKPEYVPYALSPREQGYAVGCAVKSMQKHTTNEGWEIFAGLESAGFVLQGYGLPYQSTDIKDILEYWENEVDTLVMQDKREWEGRTAGPGFDNRERFTNVGILKDRPDIFKATIVKDAQHNPLYHRQAAEEIDCHAWIVYYHPKIVSQLAPYLREEHLIRTYHTVDKYIVPVYSPHDRKNKAILSGAISGAYPLRSRLHKAALTNIEYRMHPGYGRTKCDTPNYLKALSHYKVAICTASRFGYMLRKIVEATACGCVVITDLPVDEEVPYIDGNLFRVHPNISNSDMVELIDEICELYSPELREHYANLAIQHYDYRVEGKRLSDAIEAMRRNYK